MTLNCNGQLIDLTRPKVMGILNVTPDSFYDGGRYNGPDAVLAQTEKMLAEGADFIDVGGYSSRPNAPQVSLEEELKRVVSVVQNLKKHFPSVLISVDTFRSKVALECVQSGAALVNDISAGHLDPQMLATVAGLQVPYIMMHMRGTPQTMQSMTDYPNIVKDLLFYFSERVASARSLGINDLVVDPGFGFAKTIEQNFEVLAQLELFQTLGLPLLVGLSRKSTIYKTLGVTPEESLNGTTSLNTIALLKGANLLRVHDVKAAVECVKLHAQLKTRP